MNKSSKEKKGKSSLFLILIILLLTIVIALGAIFLFDFGGLRKEVAKSITGVPIIGNLVRPIAEEKSLEEIENDRIAAEKKDMEIKEKQLNEREAELNKKEKQLSKKESDLNERELQIDTLNEQLSSNFLDVKEQIKYLEKIDNAIAVQILLNMEKKETVVQILRNMKTDKASAILAGMDPLQAAQLLEDIKAIEVPSEEEQE